MSRIRNGLGYYGSKKQAQEALDFVSSFPGNGGKRSFKLGRCPISGAHSVHFDRAAFKKQNDAKGDIKMRRPIMSIAAMRGALTAWSRLLRR